MIGIVFINELKICPYLTKYTDTLKALSMDYEIIYWNRTETVQSDLKTHHVFNLPSKEERHPLFKLKDFIRFSRFAKKVIRERQFDKLIVLTTLTGMCLYNSLIKEYNGRYILDYRDASYEYIAIFKYRVEKLIKSASFTCISSKGFLDILPDSYHYVIAHNFKYEELDNRVVTGQKSTEEKIKICYMGLLREKKYLEKLVDIFGDDPRVQLSFHGTGEWLETTQAYAKDKDNIIFTGAYNTEEKKQYIEASDMICFNYVSNFNNDKLLANKFYDALIYKKPLIGNIDIYSGQLIEDEGLGISISYHATRYLDQIYEYYQTFDMKQYAIHAERVLNKIIEEDQEYMQKINEFLKG